jgi:hypothetical protein
MLDRRNNEVRGEPETDETEVVALAGDVSGEALPQTVRAEGTNKGETVDELEHLLAPLVSQR